MVAKGRLTADGIETEALALIEAEGVDGFSFRGLSKRLGCEPMSLYHHYPSKAALMDALVDRVMGELPAPQPPGPWRERLNRMARDFRAMAGRRPAFFQFLALHRLNTPGGLRWLEGALTAFREAGLDEEGAARLFRAFGYYITGAALDETAGYARGPSAVAPPDGAEIARLYPAVAAAAPWFAPDQMETTFELGLGLLLDGVAARVHA
ncbi:MAG: TetR/AcrR family transcriptional regulator C-terminal domain-containing protein [Phenylobacterium sp.]|uniref:TetR/AcrR family transcriptional regulator n=1 Tax=Phenylobacterium sp. TaxID=1871053 RepID=UPI003BB79FF5